MLLLRRISLIIMMKEALMSGGKVDVVPHDGMRGVARKPLF
jgi:hypothetical protein